jgi:predicted nucleic acid-binding protein
MRYVLDTNTWIAAFFRRTPHVKDRLIATLEQGHELCVIPLVYYELLRGLQLKNNVQGIHEITQFWAMISYYEATKVIWDEAVRLWVMSTKHNTMPGDKDILIAAFAFQLGAIVVTRNVRHFTIFQLSVENWIDGTR